MLQVLQPGLAVLSRSAQQTAAKQQTGALALEDAAVSDRAAAACPSCSLGPCSPIGAEDLHGQESLQDVSPDEALENAAAQRADEQSPACQPGSMLEHSASPDASAVQPGADAAALVLPDAPNVMGPEGTAAGLPGTAVVAVDEATVPAASIPYETVAAAVDEPTSAATPVSRAASINDRPRPLSEQPKPAEQTAAPVSVHAAPQLGEGKSAGTPSAAHQHATTGKTLRSGRAVTQDALPVASSELPHPTAACASSSQLLPVEADCQVDEPSAGAVAAFETEAAQAAAYSVSDAALAEAATAGAVQPPRSGRHKDAAAEPDASPANAEPSAALTCAEPSGNEEDELPSTEIHANSNAAKPGTTVRQKKPVKKVLGCSKCRYAPKGCIKCRPKPQDSQQLPSKRPYGALKGVKVSPPLQADKQQHGPNKVPTRPRGLLRSDKQASTHEQPIVVPVPNSRAARAANRANLTACALPASRAQPDEECADEQLPNRPISASMEQKKNPPSGTQRPPHPDQQLLGDTTRSRAVRAELPSTQPCPSAVCQTAADGTDAPPEPAAAASTASLPASMRRSARHQQPAQEATMPDSTEGAVPDTVHRSGRVRKPALLQYELVTKAQGSKSPPDNASQPQLVPSRTGGKAASARGIKRTAPEPAIISDSEAGTPSSSTAAAGVSAVKRSARKKQCRRVSKSALTPIQEAEEAHEQIMPKPEPDFVTTMVRTKSDIAEHLAGLTPAEKRKRQRKTPAPVKEGTPLGLGVEASAHPMDLLLAAAQLANAETQVVSGSEVAMSNAELVTSVLNEKSQSFG